MTETTMTKAAFARLCEVSKPAVAKWLQQGIAVLAENYEIHLEATAESMRRYRKAGLPPSFEAMVTGVDPRPAGSARRATQADAIQTPSSNGPYRRGELAARLLALDWKTPFDLSEDSVRARILRAAEAVGFEVAEAHFEDDGHWGGYQLRNVNLLEHYGELCFEAIVAGYGFELEASQVLLECREKLTHPDDGPEDDDLIAMDLELLPALAYPFGPCHRPPATTEGAQ